jgi:hypothetical protein
MAYNNTENENADDLGYGSQKKYIMDAGLTSFIFFIYLFNANINRDSSPTDYKFKYN